VCIEKSEDTDLKKILFLMQLPPPVHGASLVNQSILKSFLINSEFATDYVDISPSTENDSLGRVSFFKVIRTLEILLKCLFKYFRFSPSLVYLTLSPHGAAFWKDSIILQVLKIFGAKCIIHLHGKGIDREVRSSRFKMFVYKKVFHGVDVIHLSKSLLDDVSVVLDPRSKTYIVNNGIHPSIVSKSNDDPVVRFLYLSNFIPTKGASVIVDALKYIDLKYSGRFTVSLAGKVTDKVYFDSMVASVSAEWKDSVFFHAAKYGEDKVNILVNSDVFVLPTYYKNECFPISILEAMSFGLPVLSTFEGAIPEIVADGENGFLFAPTKPQQLAELMTRYIDDVSLLKKHGVASSKRFSEKYTFEKFELSLINVFRNSLS